MKKMRIRRVLSHRFGDCAGAVTVDRHELRRAGCLDQAGQMDHCIGARNQPAQCGGIAKLARNHFDFDVAPFRYHRIATREDPRL